MKSEDLCKCVTDLTSTYRGLIARASGAKNHSTEARFLDQADKVLKIIQDNMDKQTMD